MSRICIIAPGDSVSTVDVYEGLCRGFEAAGHEVVRYDLQGHMIIADSWMKTLYKRRKKFDPSVEKPNMFDLIYYASMPVLERVARTQPDMVLVISARYFPPDAMILLRRLGIYVGVVLTESPYDDVHQEKRAALADVVWTTERASVEPLRTINPNTFYLRHAYDPERHRPGIEDDVPAHDVLFVGSGFRERIALLEGVDWTGIDLGLYGIWGNLRRNSPLRQYVVDGAIPNEKAAALYRRARIGLNLYRNSPEGRPIGESLNPRAYELAACGAFHISERRPEVLETFGDSVPTFMGAPELQGLVRDYLANEPARAQLAARLPQIAAGHTFAARAAQIAAEAASVRSGTTAREAVLV